MLLCYTRSQLQAPVEDFPLFWVTRVVNRPRHQLLKSRVPNKRRSSIISVPQWLLSGIFFRKVFYTILNFRCQKASHPKKYRHFCYFNFKSCLLTVYIFSDFLLVGKVHIFWEGHTILRNLHLTFDYSTYSQKVKKGEILWPPQNIWTLLRKIEVCLNYFVDQILKK